MSLGIERLICRVLLVTAGITPTVFVSAGSGCTTPFSPAAGPLISQFSTAVGCCWSGTVCGMYRTSGTSQVWSLFQK